MASKLCKEQQRSFGNNVECSDFIDGKYFLKYKLVQETEKKTECFAKFIKRVRRGLKNIQLKFIVCVSYESDLQLNYTK